MKQKWTAIFLVLVILFTLAVPAAAEGQAEEIPESTAQSSAGLGFSMTAYAALLIELNTGATLYAFNANEQHYPASLTKIMTCMLALENGNLEDILTVSSTALDGLDEAGSTAGLVEGEQMSLLNMLYCVMVSSANEACNVVAEYVSGSIEAFVDLMNQRAQELGCTGTHFANPHGLHDENHYTTAYDLSLIVRQALQYEEFRTICNTASYTLPATNMHEARTMNTTNELLSVNSANYYSKAEGVKTGFTSPARRCLISTADNGNLHLLAVILGADTVYNEDLGTWFPQNFPECINLFEYGFQNYTIATVLNTLYPLAEIPVNQSAGSQTVALAPAKELRTLVPSDYNEDDLQMDIQLIGDSVDAPVAAGDVLGTVTVSFQGQVLGTSDLTAITAVSRSEITHQVEETKVYVQDNWWKWLLGVLIAILVLIVICLILLQVYRRRERKRKVAARRRALEQRRRQQEREQNWLRDNMEE